MVYLTDEQLAEELLPGDDRDVDDIPRPDAAPLFTEEGVKLTYRLCEIMPYNEGTLPTFAVPSCEIAPT